VRDKHKTISNRSQYTWASSELSSSTRASSESISTPENREDDLKFYLTKIIESFKKDINNSLKEIEENTGKQVKALKKENNKSLKEI
jgi:DNA anti-recombination protein RmuC